MEKDPNKYNWMPVTYVTYYGMLREIAIEHGYALGLHGSVTRDFDLIAVPWTENASPPKEMLMAFRKIIGIERPNGEPYDTMEEKPHGRIAYTIETGCEGYLDISIISRVSNEKHNNKFPL
jgi:hypothetical protein